MRGTRALALAGGCLLALTASTALAAAANVVKNGSLENRKGKFTNTRCNYMSVPAGSSAIDKWTVPRATTGELAWGRRTCDGYRAAKGKFFLDLTGFGADSTNGAIRQGLETQPGTHYRFSIDLCACNDGSIAVKVGKEALSLTPGKPFTVGNTPWTPMKGQFKGPQNTEPALKIKNATPGAQIVVIDDIVVKAK
jgi:hypothetical protein